MPTRLRAEEEGGGTAGGGPRTEAPKVVLSGMVALSAAAGAASVFSQLNSGRLLPFFFAAAACVATVFVGFFGWAALLHALGGGPHGAVVVLGLTLPFASWFLIHFKQEYWLLGPAASGVPADEAGRHASASLFRFTNARVATEFTGVRGVRRAGGRGHPPRTEWYYVAPVVPEGWGPGRPVPAWAGAPVNQFYASFDDWSKPHGAGVRLASYELRYYGEAARDAEQKYGLVSADGAPFIRWAPEPEAALARARLFVLWVVAGNNLSLLLLFAGGHLVARAGRGGRRPPSGPRPPRADGLQPARQSDMESPPRHLWVESPARRGGGLRHRGLKKRWRASKTRK
jgi:hypothetical protein